jgi:hypothetical protein
MFEQIIPDVEDGLSLPTVRARIKKLRNELLHPVLSTAFFPPASDY